MVTLKIIISKARNNPLHSNIYKEPRLIINKMPMKKFKAQAAMEYLMTYGWAILIVIIVAAALFALGVFNPSTYTTSTATGFQGFQVPAGGWQFTSSGQLTLILKNAMGSNINITSVQAQFGSNTPVTNSTVTTLGPNDQVTYVISGLGTTTSGSSYSITVTITYDNLDTGLTGFKSTGTLTGSAV